MPEGDTIHKLAAAIRPRLVGQGIRRARLGLASAEALSERYVESVCAHGKHLFIRLEGDLLLRSHLGMYGSWHRYAPGERWRKPERQGSLALWTDQDVFVCFNAKEVECLSADGIRRVDLFNRLGPDLLATKIDLEALPARARALRVSYAITRLGYGSMGAGDGRAWPAGPRFATRASVGAGAQPIGVPAVRKVMRASRVYSSSVRLFG